ncbi:MAG: 3'-5' exonuclease [Flavobacteriales bacterium]|nr:3'-5' exonuclease [Flavobacteriales bacterium]
MKLNLSRPIAFFDLETTGVDVAQDRIVQIAVLKANPDESLDRYEQLINPGMHIPEESSAIHGIVDEDVKDKPHFKDVGAEIIEFLDDSDLGGYNSNKFDIPLLMEEFLRNDFQFDLSDRHFVDVQNIFHKMEKRTLRGAYKFYTGEVMENAHDAMADIEATFQVFLAQIERYEGVAYNSEEENALTPVKNDIPSLAEYSTMRKTADFAGRLAYNDEGLEVFNFGKHKGKPVLEVFEAEPSYYHWMKNGDFPKYTIQVLEKIWNERSR